MVVLFPAPFGPRKPKNSPSLTLNVIPFTAFVPSPYVLTSWDTSIIPGILTSFERGFAGLDINYIVSDTESDSILFSDVGSRIQRRVVTENSPLKRTRNISSRTVSNDFIRGRHRVIGALSSYGDCSLNIPVGIDDIAVYVPRLYPELAAGGEPDTADEYV